MGSMQPRRLRIAIILLAASLFATGALAGSLAEVGLDWWVLDSGNGHTSASGYSLDASIGQSVVGQQSSADYRMGNGYWYVGALPAVGEEIYLPVIIK